MTATIIPLKPASVPAIAQPSRNVWMTDRAWLIHDLARAYGLPLPLVMEITKGSRPTESTLRAPSEPPPAKPPKFPHKPPANSPPNRRPKPLAG